MSFFKIKTNTDKISENRKNRGLTILFATLVSILALSVGASIINLALKQTLLSGSTRESQYAFYASNTGIECAFYWDNQGAPDGSDVFATSSDSEITSDPNVSCAGRGLIGSGGLSIDQSESGPNKGVTTFRIEFVESGLPYCADVIVTKEDDGNFINTTIDSFGYNTCDDENPRRIERGLQLNY